MLHERKINSEVRLLQPFNYVMIKNIKCNNYIKNVIIKNSKLADVLDNPFNVFYMKSINYLLRLNDIV